MGAQGMGRWGHKRVTGETDRVKQKMREESEKPQIFRRPTWSEEQREDHTEQSNHQFVPAAQAEGRKEEGKHFGETSSMVEKG